MVVSCIVLLEHLKQKNTIWTRNIILLGNNMKELGSTEIIVWE